MPCIVFDLMLILLVTSRAFFFFLVTISLRIIMWDTFIFICCCCSDSGLWNSAFGWWCVCELCASFPPSQRSVKVSRLVWLLRQSSGAVWKSRCSPSLIVRTFSVDVKRHWTRGKDRAQELCKGRGGRPGLHVPNSPYVLCGRKTTLNLNSDTQSSRAVWKSRWPPSAPRPK